MGSMKHELKSLKDEVTSMKITLEKFLHASSGNTTNSMVATKEELSKKYDFQIPITDYGHFDDFNRKLVGEIGFENDFVS